MRKVVLTPTTEKEILKVFEYLELKWNEKVKRKFANKLYEAIKLISKNPDLFPVSDKNKKFRKCVITKQNSLFYHYNEKHIVVASVFDTRQNPIKVKKIK